MTDTDAEIEELRRMMEPVLDAISGGQPLTPDEDRIAWAVQQALMLAVAQARVDVLRRFPCSRWPDPRYTCRARMRRGESLLEHEYLCIPCYEQEQAEAVVAALEAQKGEQRCTCAESGSRSCPEHQNEGEQR